MKAQFAVRAGVLEGTAHLTYAVHATIIVTQATGCETQTEVVQPVEWTVQLKGNYSRRFDGSMQVIAQANLIEGPGFTAKFQDCPIPDRRSQASIGRQ